jgi:hypothetical protein
MKDVNLLLCGNSWQSLGDQESGWELVRCLRSPDPHIRGAAQEYLAEAGPRSIKLLQAAVASGALEGAVAAECMVTLLNGMSFADSPHEPVVADLTYDC